MSPSRKPKLEGIHDVNMTPLIDVSLVLVVILMVAMPMAFQSSIAIRSAAASGRTAPAEVRSERIELMILDDEHMLLNRTEVERRSLGPRLGLLLAGSATRRVVVRCADQVSHGAFVSVLDAARQHGAADIAVVGK